ncbi:hypothetical protein MNV49_006916 [Pseudohyphozyma bogoriensis]|nr:hypothetical protein MNV49_006916 [Pseudohyphozyma bogoriensis]
MDARYPNCLPSHPDEVESQPYPLHVHGEIPRIEHYRPAPQTYFEYPQPHSAMVAHLRDSSSAWSSGYRDYFSSHHYSDSDYDPRGSSSQPGDYTPLHSPLDSPPYSPTEYALPTPPTPHSYEQDWHRPEARYVSPSALSKISYAVPGAPLTPLGRMWEQQVPQPDDRYLAPSPPPSAGDLSHYQLALPQLKEDRGRAVVGLSQVRRKPMKVQAKETVQLRVTEAFEMAVATPFISKLCVMLANPDYHSAIRWSDDLAMFFTKTGKDGFHRIPPGDLPDDSWVASSDARNLSAFLNPEFFRSSEHKVCDYSSLKPRVPQKKAIKEDTPPRRRR